MTTQKKGFCLDSLKIDKDAAKKGQWFEFMPNCSFLIAKGGSAGLQKALAKSYKDNEELIKRDNEEGNEAAELAYREAYADHVLLGWEGVLDSEGKEVKYSKEKAVEFLDIEDVFEFVQTKAQDRELWRVESVKERATS